MSSQIWEDTHPQLFETQLDPDSTSQQVRGVPPSAHEEEVERSPERSTPNSNSTVQQHPGQAKEADAWTDAHWKFRGKMNHVCNPAA
jgi:hypothetical protein